VFELSAEEWTAVELSLRISVVATFVALPFGLVVAWLLARKNFWGKALLDGVVHLPLVLPPVVTGYLLLITFGRKGGHRRIPRQHVRYRVLVPLDRSRARLRGHGLSADGARHPAVVRGDRPPA
jgi:ABC-type molybdate transport system permease subunit